MATPKAEYIIRAKDQSKKGTKSATNNVKDMAKTAVKQAAKMAAAFGGITISLKAIVGGVKGAVNAFAQQERAEFRLAAAIRNNPMINGEGFKAITEYASGLQNVSVYGDELIIQQQSILASMDLSREQIEQISRVAVDLASTGMMSLDSAFRNITKTLGGTAGELGELIPALRTMDAEAMRAGDAIDFLEEQYDGMAETLASTTFGKLEQMRNTLGDVAEKIGALFAPMVGGAGNIINENLPAIEEWINTKGVKVASFFLSIPATIADLFTGLRDMLNQLFDANALRDGFEIIGQAFVIVMQAAIETVARSLEDLMSNRVAKSITGVMDNINRGNVGDTTLQGWSQSAISGLYGAQSPGGVRASALATIDVDDLRDFFRQSDWMENNTGFLGNIGNTIADALGVGALRDEANISATLGKIEELMRTANDPNARRRERDNARDALFNLQNTLVPQFQIWQANQEENTEATESFTDTLSRLANSSGLTGRLQNTAAGGIISSFAGEFSSNFAARMAAYEAQILGSMSSSVAQAVASSGDVVAEAVSQAISGGGASGGGGFTAGDTSSGGGPSSLWQYWWDYVGKNLKDFGKRVADGVRNVGQGIGNFVSSVGRGAANLWKAIKTPGDTLRKVIFNLGENIGAAGFRMVSLFKTIGDAFQANKDSIGQFITEKSVDIIEFLLQKLTELITSTETFRVFIEEVTMRLQTLIETVVVPLLDAAQPLLQVVFSLVERIGGFLIPIFNMLGLLLQRLQPIFVVLGNIVLTVGNFIANMLPVLMVFAQIIGTILVPILQIVNSLLGAFSSIIQLALPIIGFFAKVIDIAVRPIELLADVVEYVVDWFRFLAAKLSDFVYNLFHLENRDTAGSAPTFSTDAFSRPLVDISDYSNFTPTGDPLSVDNLQEPMEVEGGAAANYRQQRPINNYFTFHNPYLVGEAGIDEFADTIDRLIKQRAALA